MNVCFRRTDPRRPASMRPGSSGREPSSQLDDVVVKDNRLYVFNFVGRALGESDSRNTRVDVGGDRRVLEAPGADVDQVLTGAAIDRLVRGAGDEHIVSGSAVEQ